MSAVLMRFSFIKPHKLSPLHLFAILYIYSKINYCIKPIYVLYGRAMSCVPLARSLIHFRGEQKWKSDEWKAGKEHWGVYV